MLKFSFTLHQLTKQHMIRIGVSICFILFAFSCKTLDVRTKPKPNIILILVDDQGWSGTSVQMSDAISNSKSKFIETPNLERLASSGMRFSRGYAAAPVCSPSRYSIQFGQSPAKLNMIRVAMSTNHINHKTDFTLPKMIKAADSTYTTAHFGKWGIDADPDFIGYDIDDGNNRNKDGFFVTDKTQWKVKHDEDPKKIFSLTNKATKFIEEQLNSNNPFFLQLSHFAVHTNIMAKRETVNKYDNKEKTKYYDDAGFAAMSENLDESLGLILDKLIELRALDNTYIIYTSDNGSIPSIPARPRYKESMNAPLSRGKWDAMEGGIRVPFIVSGPNIRAGSESSVPVIGYDILPTVIDLINPKFNLHSSFEGGSFRDILFSSGEGSVSRPFDGFIFHVPYANRIAINRAHSALIRGRYKLIKFRNNDELLMFDLDQDFHEQNNLSKELKELTSELETSLDNYLKDVKAVKWKKGIGWKKGTIESINSFH